MKRTTRQFLPIIASLAVVLVASAACGNDSPSAPLVATTITVNAAGSTQTGVAGVMLALPISVHVTDQNSNAIAGTTVTWTVVGAAGSVDAATSVTNSTGDATTDWTLGTAMGVQTLQAHLAGSFASITATATSAASTAMTKVSGDAQIVAGANIVSQPMVVRVVDVFGNVVAGATVTWASTSGGTLSSTTTTTGANGQAQITVMTAATARAYTITATTGSLAVLTFTMTGS
jgi:hypothetical protein